MNIRVSCFIFFYYIDDLYGNFKEADINFSPTYKFDLRFDDTYAKHRTPAYTVRIGNKKRNVLKMDMRGT